MANASKIWVALPDKLLAQLDTLAQDTGLSRNDLLRQAVEVFVNRTPYAELSAAMAQGYQDMAPLNLALARDDESSLNDWPAFDQDQPEADPSGGS